MNSLNVTANRPGSKVELIAQFLATKAIAGQTASVSTSFNRQVRVQDKPFYSGIKRQPGEEKRVTQDFSEKICTLTTRANQFSGRQGQLFSGPGQNSQRYGFYPLAECYGQNSQTSEQEYQPPSKVALPLKERKTYRCRWDGCGKTFTRSNNMKIHQLTHQGLKPFKCDFAGCSKAFTRNYDLKSHQSVHTGHKPYKCDFEGCIKAFAKKHDLKIHKRIHTGEKPHKCEYVGCNKKFATRQNLKVHQCLHTGERPYKCEFVDCGRRFITRKNMKLHERHHLNKNS
ncbi:C2H2-type zinc finger protein [Endozoicomonas acroporae]|uniref:C2H2-type zinc finger protein n=1 Tax=Endozoicomonas acroporae TaxID=1701104 RepID=UPI000C789463|nr:C2H2-type zinc finger protein [Endozoicomonas acroporae]